VTQSTDMQIIKHISNPNYSGFTVSQHILLVDHGKIKEGS